MDTATTARIKLSNKTDGHKARLEKKGYEVEIVEEGKDKYLQIQCSGVHEDTVDTTTSEGREEIQEILSQKKLFTYRTSFKIENENGEAETHRGLWAVMRLGALSAFVAKPVVEKKPKEKPQRLKDLEEALGL